MPAVDHLDVAVAGVVEGARIALAEEEDDGGVYAGARGGSGGEEAELVEHVVAVEGALDESEGAAEALLLELDLAHEVVDHEGLIEVPHREELAVHGRRVVPPLVCCRVALNLFRFQIGTGTASPGG